MCNGKKVFILLSKINCFVLNASLKMSNVILGTESLSPVLLVLCYICNKCLLVGEENGVYFPRECVLVSERLEMTAGRAPPEEASPELDCS